MKQIIDCENLSVSFGKTNAVRKVTTRAEGGRIVGLLGRNGCGKTTLLHTLLGLLRPREGRSSLFGVDSMELGQDEIGRLGFVHQVGGYIETMNTRTHIDYIASFHKHWDKEREARLLDQLELDTSKRVGALSEGNKQKLGILMSVCHRPELVMLDEPASALDPIVRTEMFRLLFDMVEEDGATIVVSSHILTDVEKIIDHVWFLREGELVIDQPLDALQESYAQWDVTARNGRLLPGRFEEDYVLSQSGEGSSRRLVVRSGESDSDEFAARHEAEVTSRSLNLESLFPLISQS